MIRCYLSTKSINKINICMASIEMHPYLYHVSYLGYSVVLKCVLYIEKSVDGQQIIVSRTFITYKKSFLTITLIIRFS